MDANMLPKTPAAVRAAIEDAQQKLHDLRLQASANQLKRVRDIRAARRSVARLKTALREMKNEGGPLV